MVLRALALLLLLLVAACTGGGLGGDAARTDGSDPPADATLPGTASGVTPALCARAVDLESVGMRVGETVTVRGSTHTPTEIMPGPCNGRLTGHQLYRYRVRGHDVRLRATTNLPGGTPYLDTTVWALEGACSERAPVLGCNDDDVLAEDPLSGASTLDTPSLARGTELTFVVASYARARRGTLLRGEFVLAVTETPSSGPGMACESGLPGVCVRGYECAASAEEQGRCVRPDTEREPNNTPAQAGPPRPVDPPLALHAAIDPPGDVDCFALQVPEGASLWIEANDGAGSCPGDLRVELYRAGERDPLDADQNTGRVSDLGSCPRLFPGDNESVRAMPAGVYTVCVRAPEGDESAPTMRVPHYSLQVAMP
jgi:hypothetical protein